MAGFWDIVTTVGGRIIEEVVPFGLGGVLIGAINKELPDDKQLPANATGKQIAQAANSLTPEQQTRLKAQEFEIDLTTIKETNETLRTMLEADAACTHTTRPFIAKWSFIFTAVFSGIVGLTAVGVWAYAVTTKQVALVEAVMAGWPFIAAVLLAVTGTFTMLLKAYFGLLTKESEQKVGAATGQFKPNAISTIISAVKGR